MEVSVEVRDLLHCFIHIVGDMEEIEVAFGDKAFV